MGAAAMVVSVGGCAIIADDDEKGLLDPMDEGEGVVGGGGMGVSSGKKKLSGVGVVKDVGGGFHESGPVGGRGISGTGVRGRKLEGSIAGPMVSVAETVVAEASSVGTGEEARAFDMRGADGMGGGRGDDRGGSAGEGSMRAEDVLLGEVGGGSRSALCEWEDDVGRGKGSTAVVAECGGICTGSVVSESWLVVTIARKGLEGD
eukprot:CAMPEP_0184363622 /NCGR_PEP_ID=MMETSP1089-20130417/140581_1 /TAXON_ID=38269 ORGANISM="Gloeochaete wittrockiana, Strain SAG46.84" /NCGR_SAMPLE_ID=MMETSP1089 /ASSEMBLY_ACC=CAM_ASM_000445 /LENGTH=203 /DNA_ID=CAMNT_0026704193 /DNA_START=316 /DNA_END=924 /DNA_ORIENTATION=+